MRHAFLLVVLFALITVPALHAQDVKPFAHLELDGKFRWITFMAFLAGREDLGGLSMLEPRTHFRHTLGLGQGAATSKDRGSLTVVSEE